jgi:hypothetical protein
VVIQRTWVAIACPAPVARTTTSADTTTPCPAPVLCVTWATIAMAAVSILARGLTLYTSGLRGRQRGLLGLVGWGDALLGEGGSLWHRRPRELLVHVLALLKSRHHAVLVHGRRRHAIPIAKLAVVISVVLHLLHLLHLEICGRFVLRGRCFLLLLLLLLLVLLRALLVILGLPTLCLTLLTPAAVTAATTAAEEVGRRVVA